MCGNNLRNKTKKRKRKMKTEKNKILYRKDMNLTFPKYSGWGREKQLFFLGH